MSAQIFLCRSLCEPRNVLVFQVRRKEFSELESCVSEMCFDSAFGTFQKGCDLPVVSVVSCGGFRRVRMRNGIMTMVMAM